MEEFIPGGPADRSLYQFDICGLPDGSIVFAAHEVNDNSYYRRINSDGTFKTDYITPGVVATVEKGYVSVASTNDGGYLICWEDENRTPSTAYC